MQFSAKIQTMLMQRIAKFLKRKLNVVMLGLDSCGKTTILHRLVTGKNTLLAQPTFGFNKEVVNFPDMNMEIVDVGGDVKIIPLWKHYVMASVSALIYVIDCNDDAARMQENKRLIEDMMKRPECEGIPLLIFLNKIDLVRGRPDHRDVISQLGLEWIGDMHRCKLQMTSAYTGEGLSEGMTWLRATLGSNSARRKLKRQMKVNVRWRKEKRARTKRKASMTIELLSDDDLLADDAAAADCATRSDAAFGDRSSARDVDRQFNFQDSFAFVDRFFRSRPDDEARDMWSGRPRPGNVTPRLRHPRALRNFFRLPVFFRRKPAVVCGEAERDRNVGGETAPPRGVPIHAERHNNNLPACVSSNLNLNVCCDVIETDTTPGDVVESPSGTPPCRQRDVTSGEGGAGKGIARRRKLPPFRKIPQREEHREKYPEDVRHNDESLVEDVRHNEESQVEYVRHNEESQEEDGRHDEESHLEDQQRTKVRRFRPVVLSVMAGVRLKLFSRKRTRR